MQPKIEIDLADFNAALNACLRETSRELPVVVNNAALDVAYLAISYTKKAVMAQITRRLKPPLVYKIINARRKRAGKSPISGQAMAAARQSLLEASKSSIAYVKSGWLATVFKLHPMLRKSGLRRKATEVQLKGPPEGGCIPARGSIYMKEAEIWNSSIVPQGKLSMKTGNPMKFALHGFNRALAEAARKMRKHLENKMRGIATKYSAK